MNQEEKRDILFRLWEGLSSPWMSMDHDIADKGSTVYRRSCTLFDVRVFEIEPFNWGVEVVGDGGEIVYSANKHFPKTLSEMELKDQAKAFAMVEVFDIIGAGMAAYGFPISGDAKPIDEVRLEHVFKDSSGTLYGLDRGGSLHMKTLNGTLWEPVSMKKKMP